MNDLAQTLLEVKKIGGAGATILGMWLGVVILKSVFDYFGDAGSKLKGIRGDGLKKRAGDLGKRIQDNRDADALSGGRRFFGGNARRRQKRELKNQAAEARFKSGQAQFGVANGKAKELTQSIAKSNAQASAIGNANNSRLVGDIARGKVSVSDGMNEKAATDPEVAKAIAVQQERAIADAIKDVELNANFAPGDLKSIGDEMKKAIASGDSVGARAYQNMLLKAGGPGTEQYRNSMSSVSKDDMSSDTVASMKRNLLTNHAGIKETAADLVKHASSEAGTSMGDISDKAGTWSMSNEDLVKQKTHSLQHAVASGGVSFDQAKEIQGDEQLYRKLDKGGRTLIDGVVSGTLEVAHGEAIAENNRRNGTP